MDYTKEIENAIAEEIYKFVPEKFHWSNEPLTIDDILEVSKMLSENKPPKIEVFIGNYTVCSKLNCIDKTLYARGMYIEYSDSKDMKDYIEIYKNGKLFVRRQLEIIN